MEEMDCWVPTEVSSDLFKWSNNRSREMKIKVQKEATYTNNNNIYFKKILWTWKVQTIEQSAKSWEIIESKKYNIGGCVSHTKFNSWR